jgi:predicted nuclease with TOPRIM domain
MNVSKQEFDARNLEVDRRFEKLQSDAKSSYLSIIEYFGRLESHIDIKFDALDVKFDALDGKFNALNDKFDRLDAKVDRMDQRLSRLTDEVSHMNANFCSRFDVISGHLRLIDQGQFRIEQRLSSPERRVDVLEEKAS